MKKLAFRLFVFVLLVAGWALAAASLHVLITPGSIPWLGGVMVMPKDRITFRETFADLRDWTAADLAAHPGITGRLLELRQTGLIDRIERGPLPEPPATQPAGLVAVR